MNILVTGGAGFIASHIVDAFVREGHAIGIIDDLSTGVKENINPRAVFWQGSVTDADFVGAVVDEFKPDILSHHAAHIHVGKSVENPLFDAMVNISGTITLMQAIVNAGNCKKIIFASTGGAMYGRKKTPFVEDMMPAPLSPYGVSKCSAEFYLGYYCDQYDISYISLRYANVYGPRQNPHGEAGVVSIFSKNIIEDCQPVINGDGKQTRDYVFIDDVVRANAFALKSNFSGVINIGTGIETNVNEVFHLVNDAFGARWKEAHGPDRPGEQKTSVLSYERAERILDWRPEILLDEGIRQTVGWFKDNPDRV